MSQKILPPAEQTAPYAVAALRIGLGVVLLAHGFVLKVLTFGLAGTMGYFGSIGYPPALGAVVAVAETAAGLALILGWQTRLAALAMLPILLGATWQHIGNGWVFTAPNGGWEFPAFLTLAALAQAGLGSGAFALDGRRPAFRLQAA
jgi:putative oxidoreductase